MDLDEARQRIVDEWLKCVQRCGSYWEYCKLKEEKLMDDSWDDVRKNPMRMEQLRLMDVARRVCRREWTPCVV